MTAGNRGEMARAKKLYHLVWLASRLVFLGEREADRLGIRTGSNGLNKPTKRLVAISAAESRNAPMQMPCLLLGPRQSRRIELPKFALKIVCVACCHEAVD